MEEQPGEVPEDAEGIERTVAGGSAAAARSTEQTSTGSARAEACSASPAIRVRTMVGHRVTKVPTTVRPIQPSR
jgi:hypothetical protein